MLSQNSQTRGGGKTAVFVSCAHFGVLGLVLLFGLLPSFQWRTDAISINLVDIEGRLDRPVRHAEKPEPAPSPPAPVPPKPVPPEPPAPDPTPPPPPKAETPPATKPAPVPPKPQPAAKPPVQDTVGVKETPKPKPPANRLRTAEEIRRTAKLTPVAAPPAQNPPRRPALDSDKMARSISDRLSSVAATVRKSSGAALPGVGGDGGAVTGTQTDRYLAVIKQELYRRWAQPSASQVGERRPTVTVSLEISRDGKVVGKRMVAHSQVTAMDRSVGKVLAELEALPAPANFGIRASTMQVDVVFQLEMADI